MYMRIDYKSLAIVDEEKWRNIIIQNYVCINRKIVPYII